MFKFLRRKREREQQFAVDLMKAAAEGAERARAMRAMATIGIQVDKSFDDAEFCVRSVVAIVQKLANAAKQTPIWIDDDRRFTAGIFAFTLANALSFRLGVPFEQAAHRAALILIAVSDNEDGENDGRDVADMAEVYNDLTQSGRVTEAIGNTFSKWLVEPTVGNYGNLVALYQMLSDNVGRKT